MVVLQSFQEYGAYSMPYTFFNNNDGKVYNCGKECPVVYLSLHICHIKPLMINLSLVVSCCLVHYQV